MDRVCEVTVQFGRIQLILDLGDGLSGPLEPAKTADRLMHANMITVRGSHDRVLATDVRATWARWIFARPNS